MKIMRIALAVLASVLAFALVDLAATWLFRVLALFIYIGLKITREQTYNTLDSIAYLLGFAVACAAGGYAYRKVKGKKECSVLPTNEPLDSTLTTDGRS